MATAHAHRDYMLTGLAVANKTTERVWSREEDGLGSCREQVEGVMEEYAQYTLHKYRKLSKNKHHFKMPNGMPKGLRLFESIGLGIHAEV